MSKSAAPTIAQIYTLRAPTYDLSANSLHPRQATTYLSALTPYLTCDITTSFLDLACGTGLLTFPAKRLLGPLSLVIGVDFSHGMLDLARSKATEQGLDIQWFEHDISNISDLCLGTFDVITCAAALILLPDPTAAVKHWSTLLKPGGRIMSDVHIAGSNIVMDIFSDIGDAIGEKLKWDVTRFKTQSALTTVFENAGLGVEKVWESEVYKMEELDINDGESIFEKAVENPMFTNFGTERVRESAKRAFVKRLKELGGDRGKTSEKTRSWMCIARKST